MAEWHSAKAPSFRSASIRGWVLACADSALIELNLNPERFSRFGEDYYPTPWSLLKYDTKLGGYRTNLTKDQLEKAPKYNQSTSWNWNRDNDQRVYDYYKAQPYWSGV
jgi:hypothetical protein